MLRNKIKELFVNRDRFIVAYSPHAAGKTNDSPRAAYIGCRADFAALKRCETHTGDAHTRTQDSILKFKQARVHVTDEIEAARGKMVEIRRDRNAHRGERAVICVA